jgi:hypothetical protein
MPVILATWEAETWKIAVPGQPEQKSFRNTILVEKSEHGNMHCHSSYGGKPKIGGSLFRPAWAKSETYLKKKQSKDTEGMVQVVKQLPSKHKALR